MLTWFILGLIIGILWTSANNWDTCGGIEGFVYRLINITVWGSLAIYMGGFFVIAVTEGHIQVAILTGLITFGFGFFPLYILYDTLEEWYYHFVPTQLAGDL